MEHYTSYTSRESPNYSVGEIRAGKRILSLPLEEIVKGLNEEGLPHKFTENGILVSEIDRKNIEGNPLEKIYWDANGRIFRYELIYQRAYKSWTEGTTHRTDYSYDSHGRLKKVTAMRNTPEEGTVLFDTEQYEYFDENRDVYRRMRTPHPEDDTCLSETRN